MTDKRQTKNRKKTKDGQNTDDRPTKHIDIPKHAGGRWQRAELPASRRVARRLDRRKILHRTLIAAVGMIRQRLQQAVRAELPARRSSSLLLLLMMLLLVLLMMMTMEEMMMLLRGGNGNGLRVRIRMSQMRRRRRRRMMMTMIVVMTRQEEMIGRRHGGRWRRSSSAPAP